MSNKMTINMIREVLDHAIERGCGITLVYSKDGEIRKQFFLHKVSYHPQYGKNYIVGYCKEYDSELTFKVDKIIDTDVEWIDIFPPNSPTRKDGLYLVACRSDMHLEYELRDYKMGVNMLGPYENIDGIESCYTDWDVLAYHYIPYYTKDNKDWIPFDNDAHDLMVGFYTFAYRFTDTIRKAKEVDVDWEYINSTSEFISPCGFMKTESNGILYNCIDFFRGSFDKLSIEGNIEVLAYHHCRLYNEDDHCCHWNLARKMGLIK